MITVHADHVGSLLRPPELLKAREKAAAGCIAPSEFKAIEDRAVAEAVTLQDEAGLAVITDGELRRLSFQSQFAEAVEGLGEWDLDAFMWGEWHSDDAAIGDLQLRRPQQAGRHGKAAPQTASFGGRVRLPARFAFPDAQDHSAEPPACGQTSGRRGAPASPIPRWTASSPMWRTSCGRK